MERCLGGGLMYGNAFEMKQDDRCHPGRQAVAFRWPSESVSSLTLRTPISLRTARVSPKRWSFHSRPPLVSFFGVFLSFFLSFFLSPSGEASSRGGLSLSLHSWNLPASNTWKSPFRERDDSLLCVSPTVVSRRASERDFGQVAVASGLRGLFVEIISRVRAREGFGSRSFCFFFLFFSSSSSSLGPPFLFFFSFSSDGRPQGKFGKYHFARYVLSRRVGGSRLSLL